MTRLSITGVFVAAVMAILPSAPTSANTYTYDKLAYLTFTGPVQVPGVTLSAGTYRFRLADAATSRNVVQVLSSDGATVHAMFMTRTDSRVSVTQDATVSFMETPAGVPPAVKSLFYGSEQRGYEFVYGRGEPIMVAKAVPQPEMVFTPNPVAAAPVAVAEPEAEFAAEPAAPVIEPAAEPLPQEPAELPRTASPLPFVAVGGLASLLAGLGLGLLRRRAN